MDTTIGTYSGVLTEYRIIEKGFGTEVELNLQWLNENISLTLKGNRFKSFLMVQPQLQRGQLLMISVWQSEAGTDMVVFSRGHSGDGVAKPVKWEIIRWMKDT